eukprot:15717177-Heterocapsa_arctica.AAC.1
MFYKLLMLPSLHFRVQDIKLIDYSRFPLIATSVSTGHCTGLGKRAGTRTNVVEYFLLLIDT